MFSFNFSLLSVFWSIVAIYLTSLIFSFLIFLFRVARLPSFRPLSLVYTVLRSIGRGDSGVVRKLIADHEHYFQQNGYCIVWVTLFPFLIIGRYDRGQEIVVEPVNVDKGFVITKAEIYFGQGIISSKKDKWKIRHRLVLQQFSSLSIFHYLDTIRSLSLPITKSIDQLIEDGKQQVDIRGLFSLVTMKIIIGKAAGVELTKEEDYLYLVEAMEKLLCELDKRVVFFPYQLDFIYNIYLRLTGVQRMIDKTNKILLTAIRTKFDEIKDDLSITCVQDDDSSESEFEREDSLGQRRANSLCEFLLRTWIKPENGLKPRLTDEIEQAVLEEMKSIIVAGSDGVDRQLTWFIYILGCYPEYQERIYEEVKNINVEDWTMATVNNFRFLDQCFKESMRLYTAVPIGFRSITKDQMIDGRLLPKGLFTVISFVSMLRDSKIFPQPFEFKPERFAPNATPKIPAGVYLPFGFRPRDCVGQRLAKAYIRFITGTVIKSFEIKSHRHWKEINYSIVFSFNPTDPMEVTFTRR